jgi:hypothetical protein
MLDCSTTWPPHHTQCGGQRLTNGHDARGGAMTWGARADCLASFLKLLSKKRRYSFRTAASELLRRPVLKLSSSLFACPAIMTLPHRRSVRRILVTSGDTCRADNTRAAIAMLRLRASPSTSSPGEDKVEMYSCIFDNDQKSAAPAEALALRQLLD